MGEKIVIVSGACGTGKTTISRILAENSACAYAAHMHTDDFYQYIRKGYIAPWLDTSGDQNEAVAEVIAAGAEKFLESGYEVYVDGVIGPWFLEPWKKIAETGADVRYIVLRPNEESTVMRAANREQRESFPLDEAAVRKMWHFFAELDEYEANVIDTTGQDIAESAALLQTRIQEGAFRIGR